MRRFRRLHRFILLIVCLFILFGHQPVGAADSTTIYRLLYKKWDSGELWSASADGTNKQKLVESRYVQQFVISPDGQSVAYISSQDGPYDQLELHLLSLSDATDEMLTPLLSAQTLPKDDDGPSGYDAVAAVVGLERTLLWNGKTIIFTGAQQGKYAALYSYDLDKRKVKRLTTGGTHAAYPLLSPDGKAIIYQSVRAFGTGAGQIVQGIYAISPQGSSNRQLYRTSKDSKGEEFWGWIDDQTMLVGSWDDGCGSKTLRTVNIRTRKVTLLLNGYFTSAAYSPAAEKLLVGISNSKGDCTSDEGEQTAPGLYFLDVSTLELHRISDFTATYIDITPLKTEPSFYLADWDKVWLIRGDGTVSKMAETNLPVLSTDERAHAWIDKNTKMLYVSVAPDYKPIEIDADKVSSVAWIP